MMETHASVDFAIPTSQLDAAFATLGLDLDPDGEYDEEQDLADLLDRIGMPYGITPDALTVGDPMPIDYTVDEDILLGVLGTLAPHARAGSRIEFSCPDEGEPWAYRVVAGELRREIDHTVTVVEGDDATAAAALRLAAARLLREADALVTVDDIASRCPGSPDGHQWVVTEDDYQRTWGTRIDPAAKKIVATYGGSGDWGDDGDGVYLACEKCPHRFELDEDWTLEYL